MEQHTTPPSDIQKLRERVFSDPPTQELRNDLTEYTLILVDKAKELPEEQLLGNEGHGIAMDICGALAWNYQSDDTQNSEGTDGWFTKESDPVLDEMLLYASPLDADAHDLESWKKLFITSDKLASLSE